MPKKVTLPLTEQQIQLYHALAQEIVQAYQTKENILKSLNLSPADYEEIAQTSAFQRIMRQAMNEWNGATNTAKRIRLKSQWAVEEGIPYIFQSMTDTNEPLSARVEAFKAISKIGQLEAQEVSAATDRSFKIEINIGQGIAPITVGGWSPDHPRTKSGDQGITIDSEPSIEPMKYGFDIENEPDYKPGTFIITP
jgi:hypothetical protein